MSSPFLAHCKIILNHLFFRDMATPPLPPGPRLTKKQAAFRDAILAGFQPSEAYRKAFDAKGMSKKSISVNAQKLLNHKKVRLAIALATQSVATTPAIMPPLGPRVLLSMEKRLDILECAAQVDPAEYFDELNHFKSIRDMPKHVRMAIAGFKVDPVSFVTEVKFVDRIQAIRTYSQLAGDMPQREKDRGAPPAPARFDLSKLTDDELREHMRLRRKAMIGAGTST